MNSILAGIGASGTGKWRHCFGASVALSVPTRGLRPLEGGIWCLSGFVSANSRPSAARMGDLVPQWLCQCQLTKEKHP
ncbi:hypothetical protein Ddc_19226 [Ditylenchus destructor]|nr:hypothetical protein Ddc_19226 [Ditylenchus destructor]